MTKTDPLEGVVVTPRALNNAQRKALAAIVEKRLGTTAERAREHEQELEREVVARLVKRFKVDAIQSQLEKLEKDSANLKRLREDLGFECRFGDQLEITGGEAKKLLEAEVKGNSLAIRRIEDQRDALIQAIWLADTADEARRVVQQVETV